MRQLLLWTIAFLISLVFTGLFIQYAKKRAILDLPNDRSAHRLPTPRGGGLIFTTVFYFWLFILWDCHYVSNSLVLALLGGVIVALIGYLDDLYHMPATMRLAVHVIASFWGLYWLSLLNGFTGFLAVFITVWFINLYNFMDGIDGLATTEAIFVCFTAGVALMLHNPGMSLVCVGLSFILMGFLYWNWAPAKIFMGDIGSGFLGYFFGIMMWASASVHITSFIFWWIILGVFIFDATYTLIKRMLQGKKWYQAHAEHFYQRITQKGLSHTKVTLGIMAINILVLLPLAYVFRL